MIRLATVFSGIGAIEQALKKNKLDYTIVFACDNGERIVNISEEQKEEILSFNNEKRNEIVKKIYDETGKQNLMKISYMSNYHLKEENWFEDIRFIDGKPFENQVDLFVGGSPCQSFSMIGKRKGLEDARGTLFYDYARLVSEIKPKVFIYENVVGMLNHDNGNTWETIKNVFESLDYDIHWNILNSKDYGIPQDRKRLFVVGFKKEKDFHFPKPVDLVTTMFDYLEKGPISERYYLGKKGFDFVTLTGKGRAKVNQKIIRTQKANQQFNWNGDFVFEKLQTVKNNSAIMNRAHIGNYQGEVGVIRQLTPRECLRLMGFDDDFKITVAVNHMYRQAGNSIVVNVLQAIMDSILEVEKL